jgi:ribonuclease T1
VSLTGRPPRWQALRKTGQFLTLAVAALVMGSVQARGQDPGTVALAELPPEARAAHELVLSGGPFPHRKDGIVFGNREHALPGKPRGFYHEYTVDTPGARDRGARRIVCGGYRKTEPEACFYTADHYSTFLRIAQ